MISTAIDMVSGQTNGHGLRRVVYGSGWAALSLGILSGWFVVTRLGFRHELGVWDIIALRFGEGAILLTPSLVVGKFRLPLRAWIRGIPLAILWGAPFIFLVGTGLRLTSATLASSIAPALMPVFAGAMSWLAFGERPRPLQFSGYALIAAGIEIGERVPLPPGLVPQDAMVEIAAKKAAGYFVPDSETPALGESPPRVVGRDIKDY